VEKYNGYIHVFMCSQASDSCADFSWRHMQTGSRYPPKLEVVLTGLREDISTWSQRLRRPIHFHLRRHHPTMENSIRYKPEVETVPQTGSTNNLATATDINTISMVISMFWGQVFHWFMCQPQPTDTGSSYNLATENDINVISAAAAMFSGTPNPLPPASTPYYFG